MMQPGHDFGARAITVEQAFVKMKEPGIVHSHICCSKCAGGQPTDFFRVPVYHTNELKQYRTSREWFPDQLCKGFCRLVFHKHYPEDTLLIDCPDVIRDPEQFEVFKLSAGVKRLAVSCVMLGHFGLLIV
jgi:hypothetical protein